MISPLRALTAALASRRAPVVFGILTSLAVWYAWGGLSQLPVIHDEAAYLLQAQLFAHGRWTQPTPPVPEFFEQLYMLLVPAMASKYPPGHSLLLAPGALIGLPGLPVVVLCGITGGLVFALARRVATPFVALATWLFWIGSFPVLFFRARYMSEVTTSAAWLVAWWCLVVWRERRERRWMLGIAAAVGVVAITRPLSAVVLALPIAVVVVRDCMRLRAWGDLRAGVALGAAILLVLPLWSVRTTGKVADFPVSLYARTYSPFDHPGFGADATPPTRAVPPDIAVTNAAFRAEHRAHTVSALPRIAWRRMQFIAHDMWYDWRRFLAPFALVALLDMPVAAWFALGGLAVHVLLYLAYAHPAFWTVYYMESEPVLALITVLGLARAADWAAGLRRRLGNVAADAAAASAAPIVLAAASAVFALAALSTVRAVTAQIAGDQAYFRAFDEIEAHVRDPRAIVFVRYAPQHNDGVSLVRNVPDLEHARIWTVYDRGADDARLLRAAPDRVPYLFDEATFTLAPLERRGTPPGIATR